MQVTFSPSVNIIRDGNASLNYIATPNAKRIVEQLQGDFNKGLRSFNLIGSYGTGKSAFLNAFEQTLLLGKQYFQIPDFSKNNISFVKLVGSYQSIISAFANELDVHSEKHQVENVLSELFNRYHQLQGDEPLLVIVIDEMGKFLEYAAKNEPEKELYFLQQLAEFANNARHRILLMTTVHQSFETYSYELSKNLRQEWTKVKGRFTELTFNEPVEQLLYLASEHIAKARVGKGVPKNVKEALTIFERTKAFKGNYAKEIALQLFPLDLLAANVLTLALQSYGQNERSLFSFLESTDHTAISNFKPSVKDPFYSIAKVFDYISNHFYGYLHSKHNPDSASWAAIRQAIEQVENSFETQLGDYLKIVKTIGLLNIFSLAGSVFDEQFLKRYSELCLGIPDANKLITDLTAKSIVRYRKHSKRFVLSEEAEIDIELALIEAGDRVSEISDIPTVLKRYFEFAPVVAKEYSYTNGSSRYFQFEISEFPQAQAPNAEIDGFIHLIFNAPDDAQLKAINEEEASANIYVFYKNAKEIKSLLFELEKTKKVLQENSNDKVAKRELESIAAHQQMLLNHYILNNLFTGSKDISWYWNSELEPVNTKKSFNKLLTKVCYKVYRSAPIFRNELVNKQKISGAIHTAKKNYFRGLVHNWNEPDLGIPAHLFPPEKMIFRSLLLDNGLSPVRENIKEALKAGDSFYDLVQASDKFLEASKKQPRPLSMFIETLSQRPFKLKQGFIDFWIPSYLFLRRNDFALYCDGSFLPAISADTLELISKKPRDFQIKAFDVEGVRLDIFNSYRAFLNQETKEDVGNTTFIETIKPFLVFYRTLPEYAKQTSRISKTALAVRTAISKSKDPEHTFFEAFPTALGFDIQQLNENSDLLVSYIQTLQNAIREIRTCFDGLVDRFEAFIKHDILFEDTQVEFEVYRSKLQQRYIGLKRHLLLPKQRTFMQRLDSLLDDNKAWLSSMAQSLVNKQLENLVDDDEVLLHDNLKTMVADLDSLTELSAVEIDEEKEQVYNLQFITFGATPQKNIIRVSHEQAAVADQEINRLFNQLSGDKEVNKLVLTKLLYKLLDNE